MYRKHKPNNGYRGGGGGYNRNQSSGSRGNRYSSSGQRSYGDDSYITILVVEVAR